MTDKAVAGTATVAAPVTLTISDMFTLMQYENSLVVISMNGPQLKTVLERAYRNYYYYKYIPLYGGYSYYTTCMIDINAGGEIVYNDLGAAVLPNGHNVNALRINGVPVDFTNATKFYNVSTVNYLAAGSCNFNDAGVTLWPLNQIVSDTQYYVRDAVIDYIGYMGTVSPKIENRLKFYGTTFSDAPSNQWAWQWIEVLAKNGITAGCGNNNYCPGQLVTRAQMAVFLLRAKHGASYVPPAAQGIFTDVPTTYWAAPWIEEMAIEGITSGCSVSPKRFCPETIITRDQMAIFLLRAKHDAVYFPPPAQGIFQDVPLNNWAVEWIEELALEGITSGCSVTPKLYCPADQVARDQMAVLLVRTFNLK